MNLTVREARDSEPRNRRSTNLQACHQMIAFEGLQPARAQGLVEGVGRCQLLA
jgi:hypothetical protein